MTFYFCKLFQPLFFTKWRNTYKEFFSWNFRNKAPVTVLFIISKLSYNGSEKVYQIKLNFNRWIFWCWNMWKRGMFAIFLCFATCDEWLCFKQKTQHYEHNNSVFLIWANNLIYTLYSYNRLVKRSSSTNNVPTDYTILQIQQIYWNRWPIFVLPRMLC